MVEFLKNSTCLLRPSGSVCKLMLQLLLLPQEHLTNSQSAHHSQTLFSPFVSKPLMSPKPNQAEQLQIITVFGSQVCQNILCKHSNKNLNLHRAFTVTLQLIYQGLCQALLKLLKPQQFVSKATKSLKSPIPICKWFDPSQSQQQDASACWAQ